MGYAKLYEEFLFEVSVEAEDVKTEDLISEDKFKSLITKLVKHELKEELDPEEETKEVSMEGLTKEELEKVNKFIETLWVNEEPSKNEVNEADWFGLKRKKLEENLNSKVKVWVPNAMNKPTQEILNKFWEDAKNDSYDGLPSIGEDKNLIYRPSSSIKWGTKRHAFGGGK